MRTLGVGLALTVLSGCGGRDGPPATVLIENVTLIDGTDAPGRAGMTVAVDGERIVAVGKSDEVLKSKGEKTQVIDLAGKMVLPG